MAETPIPAEAVQAAATAVRDARCGHAAGRWACFSCRAEAALETAAPILAAQVRRETTAQIAARIEAHIDPLGLGPGTRETEACRSGLRTAAIIARQIGEAR